jgi:hypothetical protein
MIKESQEKKTMCHLGDGEVDFLCFFCISNNAAGVRLGSKK